MNNTKFPEHPRRCPICTQSAPIEKINKHLNGLIDVLREIRDQNGFDAFIELELPEKP